MESTARNVAGLVVGVSTVVGTAKLAGRRVTAGEARLFRVANRLPEHAYRAIWVPMQYGTFGTVPAIAAVALVRRRPRLALALGAGGTAAWLLAKAVKPIVDRGRPASVLDEVVLRGSEEGDQGFPSGHAAVSAALTVVAWPYLSNGWRAVAATLSGFVPFARMYVGAHLPLDVAGGSALGLAIGSAAHLTVRARGTGRADPHPTGRLRRTTRRRRTVASPPPARRAPRAGTAPRTKVGAREEPRGQGVEPPPPR